MGRPPKGVLDGFGSDTLGRRGNALRTVTKPSSWSAIGNQLPDDVGRTSLPPEHRNRTDPSVGSVGSPTGTPQHAETGSGPERKRAGNAKAVGPWRAAAFFLFRNNETLSLKGPT